MQWVSGPRPSGIPTCLVACGVADSYQVVARRFRPQRFEELVGQEHVAQALQGAIAQGRVGHAYLFTGARGVGKTSTARILAKALNCVQGPTPHPCGKCEICQSIARGEDVDVLEIDGASNRGIDEIRQLRQNIALRPSRARFKIYIIDEVHMLTREAFNALLKTLEEPPEHVKFIFCTTEPERVPPTVLSRCQRFDFAGIRTPQIVQHLAQIAKQEQVQVEPAALELLARQAAGSMRDAQSLLEQVLALGEKKVTLEQVHRLLGTTAGGEVLRMLQYLLQGKPKQTLEQFATLVAQGAEITRLLRQLLGYMRDVLVRTVGGGPELLLHALPEELPLVDQLAQLAGPERILALIQIADQTLVRVRTVGYAQLLAEAALVRMATLPDLDQVAQAIEKLTQVPAEASLPVARGQESASPPPSSVSSSPGGKKKLPAPPPALENAPSPHLGSAASATQEQDAMALWRRVLEALEPGELLVQMGQGASSALLEGKTLTVRFPAQYKVSQQFCAQASNRARLEKALQDLLGPGATLRLSLETSAEEPQVTAHTTNLQQLRREAFRHPWVQKAAEIFDAVPVRVDPPEQN